MKSVKDTAAKVAHDVWSHWMKYMFSKTFSLDGRKIISSEDVIRWKRQMNTKFEDLQPTEQESDYEIGENIILKGFQEGFCGDFSDGYHTFDELYEFRKLYHAALVNEWASEHMKYFVDCAASNKKFDYKSIPPIKYNVHKSWRHSNGELCFGGGWFIVIAMLPSGQISNHYEAKDWDLFKIPELEYAMDWDGHTSSDVLKRLAEICK